MDLLTKIWYHKHPLFCLLIPLAGLYRLALFFKTLAYQFGLKKITHPPIPTIVVGNLTVGGTGKTPLIIALAQFLSKNDYRPGIVSRGYGGKPPTLPMHVYPNSDPLQAGDEPVLMARKTGCPIVVDPKRVRAVRALLASYDCNIILSDDGLQHTALGRDIEIVVVDGTRRFGNGWCLPAGPLREPVKRLKKVDFVIARGKGLPSLEYSMHFITEPLRNLAQPNIAFPSPLVGEGAQRAEEGTTDLICPIQTTPHPPFGHLLPQGEKEKILRQPLQNQPIHAVAGIGNPQAFFDQLHAMGFSIIEHPFPDHHIYTAQDLHFGPDAIIIMTEKDAMKCEKFAQNNHWYLPVLADCDSMLPQLLEKVKSLSRMQ